MQSTEGQPSQPKPGPVRLVQAASLDVQSALTFQYEVVTVDSQGKVRDRQTREAEYQTEDLGNGVTLDLVKIPGGQFQMGSPAGDGFDNEQPRHLVTVPEFWIGMYPVTQAQWKAVAGFPKDERNLNADPSTFKGDNRPVESVTWDEAVEFCARLSKRIDKDYRLPSEAEWEYACRAGTTTPFHFGETITTNLANYSGKNTYGSGPKGEYREQTTPVGSFNVANAFGIYDMHGNVWEYCQDHVHDNYEGAPTDGSAWLSSDERETRILRGESWSHIPSFCRSASRCVADPDYRNDMIGFRVCCSAPRSLP